MDEVKNLKKRLEEALKVFQKVKQNIEKQGGEKHGDQKRRQTKRS